MLFDYGDEKSLTGRRIYARLSAPCLSASSLGRRSRACVSLSGIFLAGFIFPASFEWAQEMEGESESLCSKTPLDKVCFALLSSSCLLSWKSSSYRQDRQESLSRVLCLSSPSLLLVSPPRNDVVINVFCAAIINPSIMQS